ncbi:MAG TPA: FHA domain-containing protein [Acidimicrobiales bacterium]|jgi:pSer/pThr/pTyr-binding forkhead associated (FHA) protein
MSEQLLNILKICLLVLLYLFFFRVLRAVWVEVRGPALVPAGKTSRKSGREASKAKHKSRGKHQEPHLTVVEPADQAGRVFVLGDEVTVGRAAGCQVTLDDTYASQLHARVYVRDGQLLVEDLGSTNGTWLNRQKVTGPLVIQRGDRLQVGNTVMELG